MSRRRGFDEWRVLDLFCGVGGASGGFARAFPGASITGVDIVAQPNYPYTFVRADALTFPLEGYDFIHASCPCQAFSTLRARHPGVEYPDLIGPTRQRLIANGKPWVMENVPRAPLDNPVGLCGSMFGLPIRRHRWFQASFPMEQPVCEHETQTFDFRPYLPPGVVQKTRNRGPIYVVPIYGDASRSVLPLWQTAMGIPWAKTPPEIAQAIPPAYSEWVGNQYLLSEGM